MLRLFNRAQVEGLVRAAGAAAGGALIAKGFDASLVNDLVGAAVVIVMAGWSYWTKRS